MEWGVGRGAGRSRFPWPLAGEAAHGLDSQLLAGDPLLPLESPVFTFGLMIVVGLVRCFLAIMAAVSVGIPCCSSPLCVFSPRLNVQVVAGMAAGSSCVPAAVFTFTLCPAVLRMRGRHETEAWFSRMRDSGKSPLIAHAHWRSLVTGGDVTGAPYLNWGNSLQSLGMPASCFWLFPTLQ